MPTAVISVREMLAEMLGTDLDMSILLSASPGQKKVYAGMAPQGSALPYIVLGQTTETPDGAGYYHHPGHLGTEAIHCWSRTKWTSQAIFARASVLLDAQRPVLVGHTVLRGVLEYVTDAPDDDGKTWQVWARYRVRSLVAVA